MEISQLRTLIHVAELGSLSRAALRLHIAQPALSRQMRLLEAELGTPLFRRHGRGMVLTAAGQEIVAHARAVMATLEDIRASAADPLAPLSGRISIGLPPTIAERIAVPLVAAFRDTHPDARLRLVSAYSGYLLDWLQQGELDLAVLYDPRAEPSLRSQPLLLETLFLIGPASASLSLDDALPFQRLAGQRLLLPSLRHGLRILVERCAAEAGISLSVAVEADSFTTLTDLVRHGHGFTILPLASIDAERTAGRLCAAPLVAPKPVRQLVLSMPADGPASRLARFGGETIRGIVAAMAPQP